MRRTILIISGILFIVTGLAITSYLLLLNKQKAEHATDQKTKEIIIEYWTTPLYGGVVGGDGYGEWEQSLIAEFEQSHPNVKINFQIIPSSAIEQKVTVAALRNGLPDVLLDGLDRRIMKYLQFGKK